MTKVAILAKLEEELEQAKQAYREIGTPKSTILCVDEDGEEDADAYQEMLELSWAREEQRDLVADLTQRVVDARASMSKEELEEHDKDKDGPDYTKDEGDKIYFSPSDRMDEMIRDAGDDDDIDDLDNVDDWDDFEDMEMDDPAGINNPFDNIQEEKPPLTITPEEYREWVESKKKEEIANLKKQEDYEESIGEI